jgi:hypothetical protein
MPRSRSRSPPRKIAPAFQRKSKPTPDYQTREAYDFLRAPDHESVDSLHIANNFGFEKREGQSGNIEDLFVPNKELMENRTHARNVYELNNKVSWGIPRGAKPVKITNKIGDQVIGHFYTKPEPRLQYLDNEGNYIGRDMGPIKKSLVDEFKSNVKQRSKEIKRARAAFEEWNSLPLEEQERRRQNIKLNMERMSQDLHLVEIDEVPKAYTEPVPEIPTNFNHDQVGTSSEIANEPTIPSPTNTSQTLGSPVDRPQGWSVGRRDPFAFLSNEPPERRRTSVKIPGKGRQKEPLEFREPEPGTSTPNYSSDSSAGFQTPNSSGVNTPTTATRTPGSSHGVGHRQNYRKRRYRTDPPPPLPPPPPPPPPPSAPTVTYLDVSDRSWFEVTDKSPEIVPFEDIPTETQIEATTEQQKKISDLSRLSFCSGRLVIIKLLPAMKFTSDQLISKIHGGQIQEVQ